MIREVEPILHYWLQSAQRMRVRRIHVPGSRERLQINLENAVFYRLLGSGRPDGRLANGFVTFLHLYKDEARSLRKKGEQKILTEPEQKRLVGELLCYFPRALAFLKLGEYSACAQDLHHCMDLVQFAFKHSKSSSSAESCMAMMPTLHMTYYFALSAMSLQDAQSRRALYYLDRGVQRIAADYLRIPLRSAGSYSEEALRLSSFRHMLLHADHKRGRKREGRSVSGLVPRKSPHVPICQLLSQQRGPAEES
jgi:hypothetical protein